MHRTALSLILAIAVSSFLPTRPAQAAVPSWSIIPQPVVAKEASSGAIRVDNGDSVLLRPGAGNQSFAIVRRFINLVHSTRGVALQLSTSTKDPRIIFEVNASAPISSVAGYRIHIGDGRITVEARTARGLFYASDTVWDLLTPDDQRGAVSVADGYIYDYPRFSWRGFMLDSGRHFQTVAQVKDFINWMSLLKLNVFHWHLTEDQGWRLQINKYPKLTSVGACRKPVGRDVVLTGGKDKPYCGFYTQADVREIVRYAAARFVTVVPQIELPGHSQEAVAAYPALGVTGKRPPVASDTGVSEWILAPSPYSVHFMNDVMNEVIALFPSKYIHLGGDEAAKSQWKASPKVAERMKALGFANMDQLQGWVASEVGSYVASRGRVPIGETEIYRTPNMFPKSFVVMPWRGISSDTIKAANDGRYVIESLTPRLYMDFIQSNARNEPPGQASAVASLEGFYTFDPMKKGLTKKGMQHILGLEAKLWTEFMYTFKEDQHAAFPRMAAISEVAWSPEDTRNWSSFLGRMPAQLSRDQRLGIEYADSAWQPRFTFSSSGNRVSVSLWNQVHSGAIRYTTDGTQPTAQSTLYANPFTLPGSKTTVLRAAVFTQSGFLLGGPRVRRVNAQTLLTRFSEQLGACSDRADYLRLPDEHTRKGRPKVYLVNTRDMCWEWKGAPLSGVRSVSVDMDKLSWSFMGPNIDKRVVVRPTKAAGGELDIRLDTCDGRLLAEIPLGAASATPSGSVLNAPLPAVSGAHTLCIYATGSPVEGLWAIGKVQLLRR